MPDGDPVVTPPAAPGTVAVRDDEPEALPYASTGAVFDEPRDYRYLLWRVWDPEAPLAAWVLCNPSTADHRADDATTRLVRNHSRRAGYGGCLLANLFARVAPEPDALDRVEDPVGPHADAFLRYAADRSAVVVAAWGAIGDRSGRPGEVRALLDGDLHALATTADGHPRHPRGVPTEARPTPLGESE